MSESTSLLFKRALARLRRSSAIGGALSSTVLLTLPSTTGCVASGASDDQSSVDDPIEWAQIEGTRDTRMVNYTGQWWSECSSNNTRFGCGATAIHLKLKVQAVANADLNWKRVGVVYHTPEDSTDHTAVGNYFTTLADGMEEWHVTVVVPQWQSVVAFDAWYQDGAGETWIDDNEGELHVVNPGPGYQVVRVEPWLNTVTVGDTGVHGRISTQVLDLDYDKQVELVASKDSWATVLHFGIGSAGDTNKFYWTEDFPGSPRERWQIDLDLPGSADHFEFAVAYRHGVVNNARTYEFWDNNGSSNYRVDRPVTP